MAGQKVSKLLQELYHTDSSSLLLQVWCCAICSAISDAVWGMEVMEVADGACGQLCEQDGAGAGQSVPHVHIHIIPRIAKDTNPSAAPSTSEVFAKVCCSVLVPALACGDEWERRERERGRE